MLPLIPLLPFAGFVVNAFLGKRLPKSVSGGLACLAMLASFAISVISVWTLVKTPAVPWLEVTLYRWIASGDKYGRLTLWEFEDNNSKLYTLRRPWLSHPVAILRFSSDSRWLFSASNDTNKYWYFGALWKLD